MRDVLFRVLHTWLSSRDVVLFFRAIVGLKSDFHDALTAYPFLLETNFSPISSKKCIPSFRFHGFYLNYASKLGFKFKKMYLFAVKNISYSIFETYNDEFIIANIALNSHDFLEEILYNMCNILCRGASVCPKKSDEHRTHYNMCRLAILPAPTFPRLTNLVLRANWAVLIELFSGCKSLRQLRYLRSDSPYEVEDINEAVLLHFVANNKELTHLTFEMFNHVDGFFHLTVPFATDLAHLLSNMVFCDVTITEEKVVSLEFVQAIETFIAISPQLCTLLVYVGRLKTDTVITYVITAASKHKHLSLSDEFQPNIYTLLTIFDKPTSNIYDKISLHVKKPITDFSIVVNAMKKCDNLRHLYVAWTMFTIQHRDELFDALPLLVTVNFEER